MLRWFAVLLLFGLPGAQACMDNGAATAELSLDFPKPEGCKRDALDRCPDLPQADVPYVIDGVLTWSWELDPACSTTVPSATAVHIHLDGLERHNVGWFDLSVDPKEIYVEPQDQWDVTDDNVDLANVRFRSEESYPLRVTITLVGEPSPEALDRLDARNGLLQLDLRASAGSTDTFLAVTNVESFQFDGRSALLDEDAADGRDAPLPSAVLALVALALALVARRSS